MILHIDGENRKCKAIDNFHEKNRKEMVPVMSEDLTRFHKAQERIYERALSEIRAGQKRSHWMWFIFPQIAGLGFSEMARYYAIKDLQEAKDYLADPVLGKRLIEISEELLKIPSDDPEEVMGYPDDLKLCSCMTLFEAADSTQAVFGKVLEKFYQGKRDEETLRIIQSDLRDSSKKN